MKSKKLTKKLVLNKRTVTDLNTRLMGVVHGGVKTNYTCGRTCVTVEITCGFLCDTVEFSCEETHCGTCYHTCPPTWCDTECGC